MLIFRQIQTGPSVSLGSASKHFLFCQKGQSKIPKRLSVLGNQLAPQSPYTKSRSQQDCKHSYLKVRGAQIIFAVNVASYRQRFYLDTRFSLLCTQQYSLVCHHQHKANYI